MRNKLKVYKVESGKLAAATFNFTNFQLYELSTCHSSVAGGVA